MQNRNNTNPFVIRILSRIEVRRGKIYSSALKPELRECTRSREDPRLCITLDPTFPAKAVAFSLREIADLVEAGDFLKGKEFNAASYLPILKIREFIEDFQKRVAIDEDEFKAFRSWILAQPERK